MAYNLPLCQQAHFAERFMRDLITQGIYLLLRGLIYERVRATVIVFVRYRSSNNNQWLYYFHPVKTMRYTRNNAMYCRDFPMKRAGLLMSGTPQTILMFAFGIHDKAM